MIALLVENPLATLSAMFGAICLIIWPLFRTRRTMLLVQMGVTAGFAVHYALLGAETAALANLVSGLQLLAFLQASRAPWLKKMGFLLIPAMILMSALTWTGLPSLLAMSGTVVLAIGRMQFDEGRLRAWVMAGTVFWLLHDLLVGSPIAVIDAISLATTAYSIWRAGKPARRASARSRVFKPSAAL